MSKASKAAASGFTDSVQKSFNIMADVIDRPAMVADLNISLGQSFGHEVGFAPKPTF